MVNAGEELPGGRASEHLNFWERVRVATFVAGAFVVAYNLSVALHEAGHAIATVMDGGGVQEFVLNPFSWSWSLARDIRHPLFTAWGGVTFGLGLALLPLSLLRRRTPHSLRALLWILGGTSLMVNGVYLLVGVWVGVGDGAELVTRGIPALAVICLGALYFSAALWLWALAQPHLGLTEGVSLGQRTALLVSGIGPYLALIILYNAALNRAQLSVWVGFAGVGFLATLLLAAAGHFRTRPGGRTVRTGATGANGAVGPVPSWTEVTWVNGLAWMLVFGELLVFGVREAPF